MSDKKLFLLFSDLSDLKEDISQYLKTDETRFSKVIKDIDKLKQRVSGINRKIDGHNHEDGLECKLPLFIITPNKKGF